jgi:uncharacterized protein (TIGR03435 family)
VARLVFVSPKTLVFVATAMLAQPQTTRNEFDVVSVKPSAPEEHNSFMIRSLPGGTIRMAGVPLRMMIMESYGVKAFQLSGGPDWIRTARWDVLAKADGFEDRIPRAQENLMVQSMMADRFQLKVHTETKERSVYALVIDKSGPKMPVHTAGDRQIRGRYGSAEATKVGTAWLVDMLTRQLGRVVVDKTRLQGEYDFKLEWTPEPGEGGPESLGLPPEAPSPHPDTTGPSIFEALREQLGLRLVSDKGPVEMIVIDHVEKPSEN